MANVLPDREIKALIGKAILGGSADCIRVNSYEVRLGHKARFDSTGEEVEVPDLGDHFKSGQRLSPENRPTELGRSGQFVCSNLPPLDEASHRQSATDTSGF